MAQLADSQAERANLIARADYWDGQVHDQYAQLTVALNSALPPTVYAAPDQFAPVQMPTNRDVEVRGSLDNGARAVAIRLTGAQAVAIGAALIACAALGTQHSGGQLGEILPSMPTTRRARLAQRRARWRRRAKALLSGGRTGTPG
jgi:hypothetical protein